MEMNSEEEKQYGGFGCVIRTAAREFQSRDTSPSGQSGVEVEEQT